MSVRPFLGVGIRVDNGEIIIIAFGLGNRGCTRMGDATWRPMTTFVLFESVIREEDKFIERKTQAMIVRIIEERKVRVRD